MAEKELERFYQSMHAVIFCHYRSGVYVYTLYCRMIFYYAGHASTT